nr:reverse transcriptase domain-containing protein [Tanacetum cinerariifolium]
MDLKTKLETITKNHQASIQILEAKFDRFDDKQSSRPSRSLPSSTQLNSKGSSSKLYQPLQARNEHVNVVFTQSDKSYDPPTNSNDQQNDFATPINFDSEDEEEESTSQPKYQTSKQIKETPISKPYKPKILYLQRLQKEKIEARYGSKVPLILRRPFLFITDAVIQVKQKQLNLGVSTERMTFLINSVMKHSYSHDDTCFSIDVIDEILEEDFDALLYEGSEILHSIEGIILEEKIFAEFDEFMAMNIEEDTESETE